MKRFSADFFYPAIFKKYRAKVMDTPEFVPLADAPSSKRLVEFASGKFTNQSLRTALALSCITGKPFHMREFEGLSSKGMQNLVVAAGEISQARIFGYVAGSQELGFYPGKRLLEQTRAIKHVEVGAEESVTEVLHCLVPVLGFTPGAVNSLFVVGGTNVLHQQSLDAYCESVLPLLELTDFSIERDAPAPPVLGSFQIQVKEAWKQRQKERIEVMERGKLVSIKHVVAYGDREAMANNISAQLRHATNTLEPVTLVEISEEFKTQASGPCVVSRIEFERYVQVFSRHIQPGDTLDGFVTQVMCELHSGSTCAGDVSW
ncbi:hypothetical protein BASA81_005482 [Batrachochytrium salamandrivorans]|nr:hypothetical protein BASA81_005482 [Batrachochytrium salamandrivorans]